MAKFFLTSSDLQIRQEIPFEAFVDLFKGVAIRSAATGERFFELGLTNDFNMSFVGSGTGDLDVVIQSTVNRDDVGATPFFIAALGEELDSAEVERRLFAMRQLYTLYVLAQENMQDALAIIARRGGQVDYEQRLLPDDYRVRLVSIGPGSVVAIATALAKRGREHVRSFFASFYPEGRRALLDTARASADLKQLEVEKRRLELDVERGNALIDLATRIEQMPDNRVKKRLRQRLEASLDDLENQNLSLTGSRSQFYKLEKED